MKDFRITNTNHPNLDGLRAIGILMVLVSHFFSPFFNVTVLWTSIDLLFALSGLLITGILIETKPDPKYFKKFYIRRVLRIFPLYYLLILLFSIYVFVSIHPENFIYFKQNFVYFLTYTQNWYFIRSGIPYFGHLNHTWTLAIDEQIYLVWPLLIWLCKNEKQLIRLCFFTLAFSLSYRIFYNYSHSDPEHYAFFINTFCRIDSFAAGSLMYCMLRFHPQLHPNKMFFLLGISLALFLACGIGDHSFDRTGFYMRNFGCTLAGIQFSGWLYFAVSSRNKILKFVLSNRPLVYVGKISYSLYVFHWFILILMGTRITLYLSAHGIHSLFFSAAACLLLVFVVSVLSYHFFEKPIIKLKRKFSYAKTVAPAGENTD